MPHVAGKRRGGETYPVSKGSTAPTGPAGGDLFGTYPNPSVGAIEETSTPARLAIGAIPDGDVLARLGAAVVGIPANKFRVDASDTTSGFASDKFGAGANITLTIINPGGNEKIIIAAVVPPGSSDHKVLVDGADTTAAFLGAKLAAGPNVSLSVLTPGGNEQVQISASSGTETKQNKVMAASTTNADFQLACATAIATTPLVPTTPNGAYIRVTVNGVGATVGDGVRTKDCYFSGDGGATPRAFGAIVAGDLLYWVGNVALFQLSAATDIIDFFYLIAAA